MQQLLAVVLSLVALIPESSSLYYQVRPTITIAAGKFNPTIVGEYDPDYSTSKEDISSADLYVVEDPEFGCPSFTPSNNSQHNYTLPRPNSEFVVMLPYLGTGGPCSEYEKSVTAHADWGTSGLIFRYDPDDPREGTLAHRPPRMPQLRGITIVSMELEINSALLNRESLPRVTITHHYHPFPTSQTFYFIVFAFCILMLLSCLWFVMSYIKRCHYSVQRRRRRIRRDHATRLAVSRLPVKSFKAAKSAEDQTCAVCLEAFHNNDTIRVLPCKHEFHKKCVDPWLKIKQNCPMCKCSITSSPQSNNNAPTSNSNEETNAGSRRTSPAPGSPMPANEDGTLENSGDIDMVALRVDHEGDTSTTISQDSDVSNSTTQSHEPLLGGHDAEQPNVEILPYSPQIEVNMESLGAET